MNAIEPKKPPHDGIGETVDGADRRIVLACILLAIVTA
jgi:hypothetical protein